MVWIEVSCSICIRVVISGTRCILFSIWGIKAKASDFDLPSDQSLINDREFVGALLFQRGHKIRLCQLIVRSLEKLNVLRFLRATIFLRDIQHRGVDVRISSRDTGLTSLDVSSVADSATLLVRISE